MDITTILICVISSIGFIIGQIIRNLCKDEKNKGKNIIKLCQDILFGIILVFLLIICNLNPVLAIIFATIYSAYTYLRKKEHKKINLIILSVAIASTFRTEYFLYAGGTGFIYALFTGIKTKKMKTAIKKSFFVLILSLLLIYLRTL